ncbi:MAG: type II secretion system protein J [Lautropia sp.]
MSARPRGFTLIELLVACALMAVLALLSWRGLDAVLQSRERLTVASDQLRSLTLAFSQLDEDLLRSWPVRNFDLGEPALRVTISGARNVQSLQLLRESNRTGFPTRVQRIVYEVRDGQLARGFSEWSRPTPEGFGGGFGNTGAFAGAGGAVQSLVWQPILNDVRAIAFRGWVNGKGWLDAPTLSTEIERTAQLMAGATSASQSAAATQAAEQAARRSPRGNATGGAAGGPGGGTDPAEAASKQAAQMVAAARQFADAAAVVGVELLLESTNGERFVRVFSVKD